MDGGWLERLTGTRRWSRGAERAPHKPLLLLFVLGRLQATGSSRVSFADAEAVLQDLLDEFGPPRRSSPAYPFHHLQTDGFWQVTTTDGTPTTASAGALRRTGATGRLDPVLEQALVSEPADLVVAARALLDEWPDTLHADIAAAAGLDLEAAEVALVRERVHDLAADRRRRDRAFRDRVLTAYEMRCAFCEFDGRLGSRSIALDAAHVHWWSHGGPDEVDNGLCLCSFHHKLLDLGALGISAEHTIDVSTSFIGRGAVAEQLVLALQDRPVLEPQPGEPTVGAPSLEWHRDQVFRGPARKPAA